MVDYLEVPYENLGIEINTNTNHGTIVNNTISLELIKLNNRKKAFYLIKKHYSQRETKDTLLSKDLRINNKNYKVNNMLS
ncbi:hypothetical protein SAMN05660472_02467 [Natronincola ferrireducens]|uniref:Uncharacterized protein n=1 Tax=Natronincola ferrireducens TaxID=393762 RepID=A0A1G9GLV5_9FIRM|nr:hypothetical protein SAMN05660472_02467 [Natronincola ferrireducens]